MHQPLQTTANQQLQHSQTPQPINYHQELCMAYAVHGAHLSTEQQMGDKVVITSSCGHLCQEVVLWVLVQGCDGACGPKPGINAADALLPQHAVVWGEDVSRKRRNLLKELVLGQVQQLRALLLLLLLLLGTRTRLIA
jgi:hypothetical protein